MPCNTPVFQDGATHSKIKDVTGADGSTGEDPMDKTNSATSLVVHMIDVKSPGEAVRHQNPEKLR